LPKSEERRQRGETGKRKGNWGGITWKVTLVPTKHGRIWMTLGGKRQGERLRIVTMEKFGGTRKGRGGKKREKIPEQQ